MYDAPYRVLRNAKLSRETSLCATPGTVAVVDHPPFMVGELGCWMILVIFTQCFALAAFYPIKLNLATSSPFEVIESIVG
jgi:hypothetical protein